MAKNFIGQEQLTIKFFDLGWLCGEFDQRVVAVGLLFDLVGKLAPAPLLGAPKGAVELGGDHGGSSFQNALNDFIVKRRVDDDHYFIGPRGQGITSLWSRSYEWGTGRSDAGPRQRCSIEAGLELTALRDRITAVLPCRDAGGPALEGTDDDSRSAHVGITYPFHTLLMTPF